MIENTLVRRRVFILKCLRIPGPAIIDSVVKKGSMMGYNLHIECWSDSSRVDMTLEEWKSAVARVDGIRLQTSDTTLSNPAKPEQMIRMPLREGSVEVHLSSDDSWAPAITWRKGRATFGAPQVMDTTDPAWAAATTLAGLLGAKICGDEGEFYDLATGDVIE
jgi:hypothetical protein